MIALRCKEAVGSVPDPSKPPLPGAVLRGSIGGLRRKHHLAECPKNDPAIHDESPVLQIINVALNALSDVIGCPGFPAKAAHLSEARDPWFDVGPDVIVGQRLSKAFVVVPQVRSWPYHAHVAQQDVDELR